MGSREAQRTPLTATSVEATPHNWPCGPKMTTTSFQRGRPGLAQPPLRHPSGSPGHVPNCIQLTGRLRTRPPTFHPHVGAATVRRRHIPVATLQWQVCMPRALLARLPRRGIETRRQGLSSAGGRSEGKGPSIPRWSHCRCYSCARLAADGGGLARPSENSCMGARVVPSATANLPAPVRARVGCARAAMRRRRRGRPRRGCYRRRCWPFSGECRRQALLLPVPGLVPG